MVIEMKFKVSRTSVCHEERPCEEAYLDDYVYVDERCADDPSKVSAYKGNTDWWYSEGTNHRVVNGYIRRDFIRQGYFVDINSLDELLLFYKKYDDIIIFGLNDETNIAQIEIYDSYRE